MKEMRKGGGGGEEKQKGKEKNRKRKKERKEEKRMETEGEKKHPPWIEPDPLELAHGHHMSLFTMGLTEFTAFLKVTVCAIF